MTHQYVGAYYVPHGWYMKYDPQFQYDPLSTVFYKNAWYILKQPAPIGTEPTNSQYWAQYNMVPGQINDIDSKIETLNHSVSNIQTDLNNILPIVKNQLLSNRYVIIVGDSFTKGSLKNGQFTTPYWKLREFSQAGLTLNKNLFMAYEGGAGFAATPSFLSLLQDKLNIIGDAPITDILVVGGLNDVNKSNLSGKIEEFINFCKSKWPQVTPKLLWPGRDKVNKSNNFNFYAGAMMHYKKVVNYGGAYIPGGEYILAGPGLYAPLDGHPSQEGQTSLCTNILNALCGLPLPGPTRAGSFNITATVNPAVVSSMTGMGYVWEEKINSLFAYGFTIELAPNFSPIEGKIYKLGDISLDMNQIFIPDNLGFNFTYKGTQCNIHFGQKASEEKLWYEMCLFGDMTNKTLKCNNVYLTIPQFIG